MPVTQAFSPDPQIPGTYMVWLELHRDMPNLSTSKMIPYLGQQGKLRGDVKAAPEPQKGKTVFVYHKGAGYLQLADMIDLNGS